VLEKFYLDCTYRHETVAAPAAAAAAAAVFMPCSDMRLLPLFLYAFVLTCLLPLPRLCICVKRLLDSTHSAAAAAYTIACFCNCTQSCSSCSLVLSSTFSMNLGANNSAWKNVFKHTHRDNQHSMYLSTHTQGQSTLYVFKHTHTRRDNQHNMYLSAHTQGQSTQCMKACIWARTHTYTHTHTGTINTVHESMYLSTHTHTHTHIKHQMQYRELMCQLPIVHCIFLLLSSSLFLGSLNLFTSVQLFHLKLHVLLIDPNFSFIWRQILLLSDRCNQRIMSDYGFWFHKSTMLCLPEYLLMSSAWQI
jgi:hypothetical protein